MKRTQNFLNSLSNHELAFLYRYKYLSYLPNSRKLIDHEITQRNLSVFILENIVNSYESNVPYSNHQCFRCGSLKLQIIQENKKYTSRLEGLDAYISNKNPKVDRIECLVCGHVLQDDNHETDWWGWLKKRFIKKSKY